MRGRQTGAGAWRNRLGVGLGIAALLGSIALFAAVVYVSFELVQGDRLDSSQEPLDPVAVAGPEETLFSWRRDACSRSTSGPSRARVSRPPGAGPADLDELRQPALHGPKP